MDINAIKQAVRAAYQPVDTDASIPKWFAQFKFTPISIEIRINQDELSHPDPEWVILLANVFRLSGSSLAETEIEDTLRQVARQPQEIIHNRIKFGHFSAAQTVQAGHTAPMGCLITINRL